MKMKSLIVTFVFALTFNVASGMYLQADITPVNFPTPVPNGRSWTGPITNIDPVNQMIQVKDDSGIIQTFYMSQNVQIWRNGAPIQLNNLSLGDIVTITRK